jgi:hypothetical protein
MSVIWFVAGAAIVFVTALDVFQAVIVPRPSGLRFRPSGQLSRLFWRIYGASVDRFLQGETREDYLGAFAPFMLISLLAFWIGSLVVGYGLIFFALRYHIKPVPGFVESLYFAGTSLLTIGLGDFTPTSALPRLVSLCAGASGLGAFAIITTFLFAIFGSYQQRESFVVKVTNRAGAPPSGVDMIETHAQLDMMDGLVYMMRESELWVAQLLETHLAYPILTYFRSTHDNISWVAVLGTLLDASTLVITTLDVPQKGEAKVINRLASHFVNDFARYFNLRQDENVGIERGEFDRAYDRLEAAGIPMRDREAAWTDFSERRSTYATRLNEIAKYWRIPPAQWIGDRSLLPHNFHVLPD